MAMIHWDIFRTPLILWRSSDSESKSCSTISQNLRNPWRYNEAHDQHCLYDEVISSSWRVVLVLVSRRSSILIYYPLATRDGTPINKLLFYHLFDGNLKREAPLCHLNQKPL